MPIAAIARSWTASPRVVTSSTVEGTPARARAAIVARVWVSASRLAREAQTSGLVWAGTTPPKVSTARSTSCSTAPGGMAASSSMSRAAKCCITGARMGGGTTAPTRSRSSPSVAAARA